MRYQLLLVDGHGEAITAQLHIRTLREFPGLEGLSVHFRPIRNDLLFESARRGGQLGYRILAGEGIVRSQLWVEYEVLGEPVNVVGRSSDLLFALTLITRKWTGTQRCEVVAATGVLDDDGAVLGVDHTVDKLAAAVRDLAACTSAIIFYPTADAADVELWRAGTSIPGGIRLQPVAHLEDALLHLGYTLERVYLRNPFRGLEHFDYQDRAIFFGRDFEAREALRQLLRREAAGMPGLLVEGASGSGKSSFLRAGLLPALIETRFQSEEVQQAIKGRPFSAMAGRAIWRPSQLGQAANEARFARSILECWSVLPEFSCRPDSDFPQTLAAVAQLRRKLWPAALRFVWMVDQFEELFSLELGEALMESFAQFLCELQREGVWTLASIRTDSMPQLKRRDALRQVFGANEGQYYLATLCGPALDAVISLPAKAAGLTFGMGPEGKRLDELLREDAYREPDSLPQLQFTLNELYRERSGKELTYTTYQRLGGLAGSIATTAERVLSVDAPESKRAVPRLFRSLVAVDDDRRASRRYAPIADVVTDPAQKRLLERLVETRLCVTDQRDGAAVVTFAHDTLLRTLPALLDWLEQEAGLLQTRELAQRETQLWQQHGESDTWLAASDKVAAFKVLQEAEIVLSDAVRTFIDLSAARVRRARRIKNGVVAVLIFLGFSLVVAAVAFGLQQRRAAEARQMAARRGDFLAGLLNSADPRLGARDITVAQLLDAALRQTDTLVAREPLVAASMLGLIAETDRGLGRYMQGLVANTKEIALLRAHGGGKVDLSEALSLRGELLISMGSYREAEAPLREALALAAGAGATKQTGEALDNLGAVLQDSGRERAAAETYQRALDVYRSAGQEFAASSAFPLANLGVLLYNQGQYAEALHYIREAVELDRKYLPRDHPDLLNAEMNYAATLTHNHQAAEAEPIMRSLLASYQRVLGPEHVDTLLAQQGLALNLLKQRRYQEAAAVADSAADGLARIVGADHDWTLAALEVYGVAACLGGQGQAGLDTLQRVADQQRKVLDAADWRLQTTSVQVGMCLVALGRYAEAEPRLLGAVGALERQRGASFDHTQDGYRALRDLYAGSGRTTEAASWGAKLLPLEH